MAVRIDAHHHFWQLSQPFDYRWLDAPSMQPIRRDFMPEDLQPLIAKAGIERTVFVQTQHLLAENDWVEKLAKRHPFIAGIVGWVDLTAPDCEDQIVALKQSPSFVGVRHITQDEPDDNFILRPDVFQGLAVLQRHGVPFDLLFYVKHLRHAATLASRFPDLRMVIDHLAKPRIREQSFDDWRPHLLEAARFPNLYCKLSGMVTEADWQHWRGADLRPYVETALEAFGPKRCMFGSDWPVCELAGTYQQVHDTLCELTEQLSPAEKDAIFGGTATQFYQLNLA
jgi:L-fuconolactonase